MLVLLQVKCYTIMASHADFQSAEPVAVWLVPKHTSQGQPLPTDAFAHLPVLNALKLRAQQRTQVLGLPSWRARTVTTDGDPAIINAFRSVAVESFIFPSRNSPYFQQEQISSSIA